MQTSSGRLTREAEPGTDSLTPGLNPVVKVISPSLDRLDGFGSVLDEIEDHLDELVLVGMDRRQGGVILLEEANVAAEAGLGELLHMLEDDVDVDRLARDRALVREHFHPVDQLDDAIRLVADQLRQGAVLVVGGLLEQLGGAANTRQRILDLVGEHGGQRRHRARRAAMGQLAVHLVRDGSLLQHHHHATRAVEQRCDLDVDEPFPEARRAEVDAVLVHRGIAFPHLVDERQEGRAERQQVAQRKPAHHRRADIEKGLGRHVGVEDLAGRVDRQDGMRQRVQHRLVPGLVGNVHRHFAQAATFMSKVATKPAKAAAT